jgi:hypothetical protein
MRPSERSQRSGSCLQQQAEGLALGTWPAELKPQAEALYRTGRAQRLMDLVAGDFLMATDTGHPEAWRPGLT